MFFGRDPAGPGVWGISRVRGGAWALLLCLMMSMLWLAPTAAWGYTEAYPRVQQLAEGVVWHDVLAVNDLGVQRAHYIEYTPNEGVVPVVAYGQGFYGRSTVTYVGNYLTGLGEKPIAAINADFFNLSTGVPIGIVIREGTLITSAGGAYAVGFAADGSAFGGKPQLTMMMRGERSSVRVENLNKTRSSYTVNLYDRSWGTETRINSPGTNVLLEKIDDVDPYIGCSVRMRLLEVTETALSTPIAEDQMVLTVAATGDVTKVGVFDEGEEVTLSITADDERWAQAVYAVGGKALLSDGQPDVADIPTKGSSARTAIGFRDDGTVIFFVNDGKQAGYSMGLTPQALAEEMLALGVKDAIALDGGGSACMALADNGQPLSVVSSPSDGTLRKCANYIFLLNRQTGDGEAAYLNIESDYRLVLAGAAADLSAVLLDAGGQPVAENPAENPDGACAAEWSVADGMGEVADGRFIAGDRPGKAVITARAAGVSGSQNIYVLRSVDGLRVMRGGKVLSELSVVPGDKIQLDAAGLYKGEPVALDNAAVEWELVGDIGNIDGEGYYHAGGSDPAGSIIVSLGDTRAELPVMQLIGGDAPVIVGVSLPAALASGEVGKFSFRVTAGMGSYYLLQDQIELLLDGEAAEFSYDYDGGVLTAEISDIADGLHRLTVVATDDDAKMARKSLVFRVGEAAAVSAYADVPQQHWAADYIGYLGERGLMQGEITNGESTFNPSRNLTRAEFAVVAARYLGLPEPEGVYLPFADSHHIPEWAKDSVKAIYAAGIMGGEDVKGKLFFYPRNNISRQEAMAVISRILGDGYTAAAQSFADSDQISAWAAGHIDRLVTMGLVGGYQDDTIRPLESITRAEIAKVLFGLY